MKQMLRIYPIGAVSVLLLLLMLPIVLGAQAREEITESPETTTLPAAERTAGGADDATTSRIRDTLDCDDTDPRCDPTAGEAETNICDGVRCPDGSCAATSDECTLPARESAQAEPAREQTAEGRTHEDSETPQYRDPDDDGDTLPTTFYPDADGDGFGTPAAAQSHNSSRSNRTEGVAADWVDPDDDGDGLPETFASFSRFIKIDSIDGESRGTSTQSQSHMRTRVSVDAATIRELNETERVGLERARQEVASNTPEFVGLHIIERMLADQNITNMEVDPQHVALRYRAEMRFLGIFPMQREVSARATTDGNTEIDYPWYRIFMTTPDTERIRTTLLDTMDILVRVPEQAG